MSIYRHDRPNAPYAIQRSLFGTGWIWRHRGCDRPETENHGRSKTWKNAIAMAAVHATTEHGASLGNFRSVLSAEITRIAMRDGMLREMGVLDAGGTPRTPVGSRIELHATSKITGAHFDVLTDGTVVPRDVELPSTNAQLHGIEDFAAPVVDRPIAARARRWAQHKAAEAEARDVAFGVKSPPTPEEWETIFEPFHSATSPSTEEVMPHPGDRPAP